MEVGERERERKASVLTMKEKVRKKEGFFYVHWEKFPNASTGRVRRVEVRTRFAPAPIPFHKEMKKKSLSFLVFFYDSRRVERERESVILIFGSSSSGRRRRNDLLGSFLSR